jgi:5-methyltetrahydropteroyltriglutamate--homocysteine methyltransferase
VVDGSARLTTMAATSPVAPILPTLCPTSFRSELVDCRCDQVSIETAQSGLDPMVLGTFDGKTVIFGVIEVSDHEVETPDVVAHRVRRVLPVVDAEDIVLVPCRGMKYLPRDGAEGKLRSMAEAARMLRAELDG